MKPSNRSIKDLMEDKRLNKDESRANKIESAISTIILVCLAIALFMVAIMGEW